MKNYFMYIILISLFFTSGCASMKHNYIPEVSQMDFPAINKETTVYVGESMIIQGTLVKRDILKVNASVDGACYDIPAGTYSKTGSDSNKQYFSVIGDDVKVIRAGLCDPISGMYVANDKKMKYVS